MSWLPLLGPLRAVDLKYSHWQGFIVALPNF